MHIFINDRPVSQKWGTMAPRSAEQFEKMRNVSKMKIAENAMRLFAKNGYGETSVEKIASASGVAKGLVYNYFANKEELLLYCFTSAFEELELRFASMIPPADPAGALEQFINGMFDFVKENSDYWRLQLNTMMQPSVPPRLQETIMGKLREYIAMFTGLFSQLGIGNARGEAWLFAASIDGVFMYYILDEKNCPIEEARIAVIERFRSLIGKHKTGGEA